MFKNIKCQKCNEYYDDGNELCPHCGEKNIVNPRSKGARNVIFLHFFKQIGLFLIGFLGFQLIGSFVSIILGVSLMAQNGFNPQQLEEALETVQNTCLINFTAYGLTFVGLVLFLWKDNFKIIKTFKDWLPYVAGIVGFVAILAFSYLYNYILALFGIKIAVSDNQNTIEDCVKYAPVFSIIFFALIGPITEELAYRLGCYSFFRRINKYLAFAVTIIVFTLIHFNWSSKDIVNELWNLPIYFFGAFTLTFLYEKFGLSSSITAHILNNLFSVISIMVSGK